MSYPAIEDHILQMVRTFVTKVTVPGREPVDWPMFIVETVSEQIAKIPPRYIEIGSDGTISNDGLDPNNPVQESNRYRVNDRGEADSNGELFDDNAKYRDSGIAGIAQYELLADPKDNMCFIEAGKPRDATPMGFGRTHDRFYQIEWAPMIHLLFRPQPDDRSGEFRLEDFNSTLGTRINEFLDEIIRRPTLSYFNEDGDIVRYSEEPTDSRNSSQILMAEPVVAETNIFRGESGPYNFYVGISITYKVVEGFQLVPIL